MGLQIWFWIFYVLALVGNFFIFRPADQPYTYRVWGGGLLFFILIGLLGYQVFGSPIK